MQQSSHVPAVSKQGHPERKGKKTDSLVLKHNIHHIQALDNNKIILYTTPEGNIKIEVIFDEESFWLNQKRMADLFGADVRTINEHLQNIYKSGELQKEATIRNIRIVQKEGSRKISAIDNFMY